MRTLTESIHNCSSLIAQAFFFLFYDNHNALQSPHYSAISISYQSMFFHLHFKRVVFFFLFLITVKTTSNLLSHFPSLQRLTWSPSGPLAPRWRPQGLWRPTRDRRRWNMLFIAKLWRRQNPRWGLNLNTSSSLPDASLARPTSSRPSHLTRDASTHWFSVEVSQHYRSVTSFLWFILSLHGI